MKTELAAARELDHIAASFQATILPKLRQKLRSWMDQVYAKGGPSAESLTAPRYGVPDTDLVKEAERLILFSYLVGMDHASSPLDLSDDPTEFEAVPFSEAIAFMKARVPLTKPEWNELEEQVRFRAFTVAALSEPDAIERVRRQAIAALEQGRPMAEFWDAARLEDAAGIGQSPWYWETVYRTNTQTAYNAGRAAEFTRNQPDYLEFVGIEDSRQTSICSERSGIILPATHPFWSSNWPPLHFNCRSTVRALYQDEVDAIREQDPIWQPSTEAELPGGTSASGFGGNPIQSGSFWKMTQAMKERAEKYGIMPEIGSFAETLGIKNLITPIMTTPPIATNPAQVPLFKSIKEAEVWVVRSNLSDRCSFKGCNIEIVQEWVENLHVDLKRFPKARVNMQFFGTVQERNKEIKARIATESFNFCKSQGFSDDMAKRMADRYAASWMRKTGLQPKPGVLAQFTSMEGFKGVAINTKYADDYKRLVTLIESNVRSGHFPSGVSGPSAILHHEVGHLLDHTSGLMTNPELYSYWKGLGPVAISQGLSRYAATNVAEFIAEAWSEYSMSPTPREIASKVGSIIVAAGGGVR